MGLNFAGIFPTSVVITHALLHLAAGGSYLQGLREEVERVGASHSQTWNQASLGELWRVDSAIKETLRMCGPLSFALPRKVRCLILMSLI